MEKEIILICGEPIATVPSGDAVLILRNGVVIETRPIMVRMNKEDDDA